MENDENSLRQFLQRNQPAPPPAPADEWERIQHRTNGAPRPWRVPALWFGLSAAAVLLVVFFAKGPVNEPQVDVGFVDEETLPTLDVGEDYLEIASLNL